MRRAARLRAAWAASAGILAMGALGWALVADQDIAQAPRPPRPAASTHAVGGSATGATLVDVPPVPRASTPHPFNADASSARQVATSEEGEPFASVAAVPTAAMAKPNPFMAIEASNRPTRPTPSSRLDTATHRTSPGPGEAATVAGATLRDTRRRAPDREPDLLQTLMDNIQHGPEPARDTRAMDRLTRRLDREPMPAPGGNAPRGSGETAGERQPGASKDPPAITSLRTRLEQCAPADRLRGQWCRRRVCQRAGLEPHACLKP